MITKTVVKWVLLAFVAACIVALAARSFRGDNAVRTASSAATEISSKDRVVALYFVGRVRCQACEKIERLATKAIEEGFPADLGSGRLAFRQVNVDLPGNEHFASDFEMANRTLVLAEYRGGKAIRYEKLDQVWSLYDKEKAFDGYVKERTRAFLAAR